MQIRTLFTLSILNAFAAVPLAWAHPGHEADGLPDFHYDQPDQVVAATMHENPESYNPCVNIVGKTSWMAWLDFRPGEGDVVMLSALDESGRALNPFPVTAQPARYAYPTITVDASGQGWLSWEAFDPAYEIWNIMLASLGPDGAIGQTIRINEGRGHAINHRLAAHPDGGLWCAWQGSWSADNFDVFARRINPDGSLDAVSTVSNSNRGDWHPAVGVTSDGRVIVAWDSYDGTSFNVLARQFETENGWSDIIAVAQSDAFEGRADIACDSRGHAWITWEEGSRNWGKPYRGIATKWNGITDAYGPVHRFRMIHLAQINADGSVQPFAHPMSMPALGRAKMRADKREGAELLGAFYERPRIVIDGLDRLWVVYRHFYQPQLGSVEPVKHHVEAGWSVYARCIDGAKWSKLFALDQKQRDGLQRLSVTGTDTGVQIAWSVGRTDRRDDPEARGIGVASVVQMPGQPSRPGLLLRNNPVVLNDIQPKRLAMEPTVVGGIEYQVFFGDLHRHTDLSLCFPFYDGSLDDAYRYGIEAAELDFLGVTDHARDIAQGNALSQMWWRSTKEVTRHLLKGHFEPYFAFERSTGNTDHNVISLRDDMLRSHRPLITEFWKEMDLDTITIPHGTAARPNQPLCGRIWEWHDDIKRPLLEMYQGFRDDAVDDGAKLGLDLGYHFGFIASSDHLSTSASYACVWSPMQGREPVFRSMQSRRTYGATDNIRLIFRSGDRWMGERMSAASAPLFQVEIDGTAPIETLTTYVDGEVARRMDYTTVTTDRIRTSYIPTIEGAGEHYVYIHVMQSDGNQAWSSPIWVTLP